jgi:Bacterial TniB protein
VDVSRDYAHLHDSVRALLEESDESRIRRIRADRWVGYARADAALSAFEVLLTFPKRTRMPNLLLCGPTNNGKSMVLEKFRRAHPPLGADLSSEGIASIPVLKIQMPPGPDERRFFGAILDALALPHGASESLSRRQDATLQLMQSTGVRLLIIDLC